jgi:hypothetical protein
MDCLCNVGQPCSFEGCGKRGERDGVYPDRAIPGAAWCSLHAARNEEERTRIWQQRVAEQEERERNAAP